MARATVRTLRTIFWDDTHRRARTPWLVVIPLVGAFLATSANALVPVELPLPVTQLLATGAPAVAAVLLVMFSRRFLGGRKLVDYGLAIDRRWIIDLSAGLVAGLLAVSIPFMVTIGAGWAEVVATFDPGDLALWPGILLYAIAMLCTGFWEELVLRGVFLCNAADGLRRWLSPQRAVAGALTLSALVFALGHVGQTGMSVTMLTFILSGVVLGVVYLFSGNLALVIGAHATFNITSNVLFARAGGAADGLSAIMRIEVDPTLTLLRSGGLLEAAAFLLLGLFGLLWLKHSRGSVSIDLAALHLADEPDFTEPTGRVHRDMRHERCSLPRGSMPTCSTGSWRSRVCWPTAAAPAGDLDCGHRRLCRVGRSRRAARRRRLRAHHRGRGGRPTTGPSHAESCRPIRPFLPTVGRCGRHRRRDSDSAASHARVTARLHT